MGRRSFLSCYQNFDCCSSFRKVLPVQIYVFDFYWINFLPTGQPLISFFRTWWIYQSQPQLLQRKTKLLLCGCKLNAWQPCRCNGLLKFSHFFALCKTTVYEVDLLVFPNVCSLHLENNDLILLCGLIFFRASPV